MSSAKRPTYYSGPSLQDGMEWVRSLTEGRGGRSRVLIEAYEDKQGRKFSCVAVQYWRRQQGERYEGWASEELRVYGDSPARIGSILMKLVVRLDHKLTARERSGEEQAHF